MQYITTNAQSAELRRTDVQEQSLKDISDLTVWLEFQTLDILKNIMRQMKIEGHATRIQGNGKTKAEMVKHVEEHVKSLYEKVEAGKPDADKYSTSIEQFLITYCSTKRIQVHPGAPTAEAYNAEQAKKQTIKQMWEAPLSDEDQPERFFDDDFRAIT